MNLEINELTETIETLKYLIEFNGKLNTTKDDVYHLYTPKAIKRFEVLVKKLSKLKRELHLTNALLDNEINDFEYNNEYERYINKKCRVSFKSGSVRGALDI